MLRGNAEPMALLFFISLWPSAHTFNIEGLFIKDLLKSTEVKQCDLGYVYDGQKPKVTNEILESFNER